MFYTHVTKSTQLLNYSNICFVYFVQDHHSATAGKYWHTYIYLSYSHVSSEAEAIGSVG